MIGGGVAVLSATEERPQRIFFRDPHHGPHAYWFTRELRDEKCEFCKADVCVQQVYDFPNTEGFVVVHDRITGLS